MTIDKSLNKSSEKPSAEVTPSQGISIVWFVPFIALIFGSWLGIKALSDTRAATVPHDKFKALHPKWLLLQQEHRGRQLRSLSQSGRFHGSQSQ